MKRISRLQALRSQKGLTLVEIIIVLVILSLLMTFLTSNLFKSGEKAKANLNDLRMGQLKSKIQEYQLMNNTLPPSLESLVSCDRQSGGGSCVPIAEPEDLKDAWGTPLQFQSSGNSYQIKSLGADKREGGEGVNGDAIITGP